MAQTVFRILGVLLILLAGLSILDALDVLRYRGPLTSWMYSWGRDSAWVARVATGAVGASLLFLTPRADD